MPGAVLDVEGTPTVSADNRFVIEATDDSAMAAGVGGGIGFCGKYTTAGDYAEWAGIKGIKENATSENLASSLIFSTRGAAGTTERVRIDSSGNVGT